MANESGSWDQVISDRVLRDFCDEVKIKLAGGGNPARGLWSAKVGDSTECTVWTDASDVGFGAVLQVNGVSVED